MADSCIENVIEFLRDEKTMTVTLSQGRFITQVRELEKKYPEEVQIVHENEDGSIVAHMPVKALHLSIIRKNMTEEQKEAAKKRLEIARESQVNK